MQTEGYTYTQVHPSKPIPRLTRKGFLLRIALSVVVEAGFVALCAVCLPTPLPLNIPLSLSNAKAFFTAVCILWQLLSMLPLGGIVDHCFSGEWYFQLARTGNLVPGRTDVVSILTAGMLDHLEYAITPRASKRFRVAFMITLMSIVIRTTFPSSLSPASVMREESARVQISIAGDASSLKGADYLAWLMTWFARADMIAQLEQQKVVTFGLQPPMGWMVGWPSTLAKDLEGRLRYPTDVVHFDFQCKWETQDFLNAQGGTVIGYGRVVGNHTLKDTMLIPIGINDTDDNQSVYLFTGQNSQTPLPIGPGRGFYINLDGLPTFNASGLEIKYPSGRVQLDAPISALLVCDSHVDYSGGEAQLYPNGTIAITQSGNPPIGNILESFIGTLFQLYVASFFSIDIVQKGTFTLPAIRAFLPLNGIKATNAINEPGVVSPLSLEEISSNLNGVAASISKSFSSGTIIGDNNFGVDIPPMLQDVDGWLEKEKLVLTTNPRLFWIGIGLWSITICLLVWLGWLVEWETMKPFALDSILDTLKGSETERTEV